MVVVMRRPSCDTAQRWSTAEEEEEVRGGIKTEGAW